MSLSRRSLLAAAAATPVLTRHARAAGSQVIRIGVMNDMTGPLSDDGGPGSAACVQQAIDDLGNLGFQVQVLTADHQNKPDVGVTLARQWYDQADVDLIIDVPISSIAFGISTLAREKNKMFIASGSGSTDITGKQCSPNTTQWTYDTYMLAKSIGTQVVKSGGDKWFFITADYVFGHQLEHDTAHFVEAAGGKVLGTIAFPFPGNVDFSSYLLKAQASGANVLGVVANGQDLVNCVKQVGEFGLSKQLRVATPIVTINNIVELGTIDAKGIFLTETFYWDMNDRTRAFTKRVLPNIPGKHPPNMLQAGCYSGAMHYLKAVAALGVEKAKTDGRAVVEQMKRTRIDDDAFGAGSVRIDGRTLFPAYLFEVKSPSESRTPWDCYKLKATTSPEDAWPPLGRGCEFIHT